MKKSKTIQSNQPSGSPGGQTARNIFPSLKEVEDISFPIIDTPTGKVNEGIDLENSPAPSSLKAENNCFYWVTRKNGDDHSQKVTNYIMYPLYLFKSASNPKRLFLIRNSDMDEAIVCLSSKSLQNISDFSAQIEGQGNFVNLALSRIHLGAIKAFLYDSMKEAQEVEVLGQHTDSPLYFFANGAFDGKAFYKVNEFGICDTKNGTFYLPPFSKVNEGDESEYSHERKFIYKPTDTQFSDWAQLFFDVYGQNAIFGICFLVSALFRDIVFQKIDCFPILFLFGPPKTGKSTFRESLLALFGEPQTSVSLGSASSPKGFARKLSQFRNALICFEEYKNRIKGPLKELLKSLYDGMGYERARMTNDNRTHSTPVHSACIVAGQEMPTQENALFTRVIQLEFSQMKWEPLDKKNYSKLKEIEREGLGNVVLSVLQHRQMVLRRYRAAYDKTYQLLKEDKKTSRAFDRTIMNMAAILAPLEILKDQLRLPFTFSQIVRLGAEQINEQNEIMMSTSEVAEFWQVVEQLNGIKINKGYHFDIKDNVIHIRVSAVYPFYKEYADKQGLNTLDKQTLIKYLKQHPSFISNNSNKRDSTKVRFVNGESYWTYGFDYAAIKGEFLEDEF